MSDFWQDLKYAARMLRKNPGFTAAAVLTLALGIGANTAIFSVVNAVLLRPLPYRDPATLVWISEPWPRLKLESMVLNPEYSYWHMQSRTLEGVEAYGDGTSDMTGDGEPERISGARVTAGFFHLLGIEPFQGRSFSAEEDQPGGRHTVILSYGLWQRRFGSDPNILGRSITLDDVSYSVVGILPAGFQFPDKTLRPELFTPLALPPPDWGGRRLAFIRTIGRLKPSVSMEQARSELFAISQQHVSEMPAAFAPMRNGWNLAMMTLHEKLVGDVRTSLLVLLGAVVFVLLIACANIANLQLVRTAERRKEFAVRAAIGADRGALIRQLLTESILLAGLGGAAGLLVAVSTMGVLRALLPANLSLAGHVIVDRWVLAFAVAITSITGTLFGTAPAISSSRSDINAVLRDKSAQGGGYRRWAARSVLVVSELALAVMLLAGSGLLIRSFFLLSKVQLGMDPSNLLTVRTSLPPTKYSQGQERQAFFDQVLVRIESLPGVQSVATTTSLPLTGAVSSMTSVGIEGQPPMPPGLRPSVPFEQISPDYFRVLRIPLLTGRIFDSRDSTGAPVVIVNRAFARRFFGGEDAVGKRIRLGDQVGPLYSIVGVVGDVRHAGPGDETEPEFYSPYTAGMELTTTHLVIRASGDPLGLAAAVRAQVESVDPEEPVSDVATMEKRLSDVLQTPRFNALLLGAFAVLALLLAAVGIFGVIAYLVSQRTHEIAIRVALGASPANVLHLIMRQGLTMILLGLGLGLVGSLVLTRYLASLLFEIRPRDPFTFLGVAFVLAIIALTACYIPARRAMRVDPMVALRHE